MRAVLQRVAKASVHLPNGESRSIGRGVVVLLGVAPGDRDEDVRKLAEKIANMRVFPGDGPSGFDRSLVELGAEALVVSQFTLFGDCRKGRRPDFTAAARPELAEPLYRSFAQELRRAGVTVQTGEFGADMKVELVNDGPVTLALGFQ